MSEAVPQVENLIPPLRARLSAMDGVAARRMFGADAYFVGDAMFAFFSAQAVVLRLPGSVFTEAAATGRVRPFLSMGAAHLNGWAEVPLVGQEEADLEDLLRAAHSTGIRAARTAARRRRPTRARRTRRTAG